MSGDLFVGVTSWNSLPLLEHGLASVLRTAGSRLSRLVVFDNGSEDGSPDVARRLGADVVSGRMPQADALNVLLGMSSAPYTLLLHADVILLAPDWLDRCARRLDDGAALVAPEDVGCGPFTRTFGAGKPESSFLLFHTARMRRLRGWRVRRVRGLPVPRRLLDLYGAHVTHDLPERLARAGMTWVPLSVHVSDVLETPLYRPAFSGPAWWDGLFRLRYGLGNFYALGGAVTHYHNWYDRVRKDVAMDSDENAEKDGGGLPAAFIRAYTEAFLRDLARGDVHLPSELTAAAPSPVKGRAP